MVKLRALFVSESNQPGVADPRRVSSYRLHGISSSSHPDILTSSSFFISLFRLCRRSLFSPFGAEARRLPCFTFHLPFSSSPTVQAFLFEALWVCAPTYAHISECECTSTKATIYIVPGRKRSVDKLQSAVLNVFMLKNRTMMSFMRRRRYSANAKLWVGKIHGMWDELDDTVTVRCVMGFFLDSCELEMKSAKDVERERCVQLTFSGACNVIRGNWWQ